MVVIWCFTYNQRNYIGKCLDGFVMQKTNFRFEAIVHDDASSDGTDEVVREYANKYPTIIKPIFEKENQYSKYKGFINNLMDSYTPSKYVAVCEGDDYWTDPYKLQKQFDLLESDSSISMCHHNFYQLFSDGRLERRKLDVPQRQDIVSLARNNTVQTLTMFFRCSPPLIPQELKNQQIYSSFWAMRLAEIGDIYYIDEPMAVYRFNEGGIYSMQSDLRKFDMAISNIDTMVFWYSIKNEKEVVKILKKKARKVCFNYLLHFIKVLDFQSSYSVFKRFYSYL